jgi:ubiquinone/menaquinone biosynthesis C-methylase UbiE
VSKDRIQHDSSLQQRVERERAAHTERDVVAENARIKERFPHVQRYLSKRRLYAAIDSYTQDLSGKTVLDYGCGRGEASLRYLANGAERVQGIDISPVYIEQAAVAARKAGCSKDRCSFRVMDAHALDYQDETFDLVIGLGILHHLDAGIALSEIYRVLKPGGRVLVQEPLADNPLLKLFRLLTPSARTEDEAPFTGAQIEHLLQEEDWKAEVIYFGIVEAPVAMATSVLMPRRPENALLRLADRLEQWTHERGVLLSWNQYVLFNMVKQELSQKAT